MSTCIVEDNHSNVTVAPFQSMESPTLFVQSLRFCFQFRFVPNEICNNLCSTGFPRILFMFMYMLTNKVFDLVLFFVINSHAL